MRILHLSDTHLDRSGGPDADGADGTAALRRPLSELGDLRDLDAVVVTGDVADDGSHEAYARADALPSRYAGRRGADVFYTTGNHDDRSAFADVLGSGHAKPEAAHEGAAGERTAASTIGAWRLITLDIAERSGGAYTRIHVRYASSAGPVAQRGGPGRLAGAAEVRRTAVPWRPLLHATTRRVRRDGRRILGGSRRLGVDMER